MADIKKIAEMLDYPGDLEKDGDELLQAHIEKTFVARSLAPDDPDLIKTITGRRMGSINTALNRVAKAVSIEFSKEETEGKKIEDILDALGEKVKGNLEELKKASVAGDDKKVEKLSKAAQEWEQKYNEISAMKTNVDKELETERANFQTSLKKTKIDLAYKDALGRIQFSETASPILMKGFNSLISETYAFDIDESENVIVKDAKTGQRIQNANKTDYLGLEDILKSEAEKAEILKKNNSGKTTSTPPIKTAGNGGPAGGAPAAEFKNPFLAKMEAHAEMLKEAVK
jgi:hypothetical protein